MCQWNTLPTVPLNWASGFLMQVEFIFPACAVEELLFLNVDLYWTLGALNKCYLGLDDSDFEKEMPSPEMSLSVPGSQTLSAGGRKSKVFAEKMVSWAVSHSGSGKKPVCANVRRDWKGPCFCAPRNCWLGSAGGRGGGGGSGEGWIPLLGNLPAVKWDPEGLLAVGVVHEQLWEQPKPLFALFFLTLHTWSKVCYIPHAVLRYLGQKLREKIFKLRTHCGAFCKRHSMRWQLGAWRAGERNIHNQIS